MNSTELTTTGTVIVVDDNKAYRESLLALLESAGLAAEAHPNAQTFLDCYEPDGPKCLVLDIRIPGMSGLELQDELARRKITIPTIIVSAHGNIEKVTRAMKAGAVDFIKKPFDSKLLLQRIRAALESDLARQEEDARRAEIAERLALLTPRECEILDLLVQGKAPKQIAFALNLSRKTIDAHKGHIMIKLRAASVVDLVWLVQLTGRNGNSNHD